MELIVAILVLAVLVYFLVFLATILTTICDSGIVERYKDRHLFEKSPALLWKKNKGFMFIHQR
jgi:hypothetical protein